MLPQWPELHYNDAKDTYDTLHLFTQMVGKVKVAKLPWINHSWHVTLQVTPQGLSTGTIPDGERHFKIDFDFAEHKIHAVCSSGRAEEFGLRGISVAGFYGNLMGALEALGVEVSINTMPNE